MLALSIMSNMESGQSMTPEAFREKHGPEHTFLVKGGRHPKTGEKKNSAESERKAAEAGRTLLKNPWYGKGVIDWVQGHRAQAQQDVARYKKTTDAFGEIRKEAEKYLGEFQQQANDLVIHRGEYEDFQIRLAEMFQTSPSFRPMDKFVDAMASEMWSERYKAQKSGAIKALPNAESDKGIAENIALTDFLRDSSKDGEPRLDMMKGVSEALQIAQTSKAQQILKVAIAPKSYYGSLGGAEYKYLPIPDELTGRINNLIAKRELEGTVTYKGTNSGSVAKDYKAIEFKYELLPLEIVRLETFPKVAKLTYRLLEKGRTGEEQSITIADNDGGRLRQRIIDTLRTGEQACTNLRNAVVDIRIIIDGKEIPVKDYLSGDVAQSGVLGTN